MAVHPGRPITPRWEPSNLPSPLLLAAQSGWAGLCARLGSVLPLTSAAAAMGDVEATGQQALLSAGLAP